MDDGRIDWRRIIYSIKRQLIGLISRRADAKGNTRCVILDDTDLPKRGMKAEGLGKVFSHTAMKCIMGFKIAHAIKTLRRAIVEGLRFDYLLVDSWFPCAELLQFIHGRHFKCHVIGMIKMGKTKYETALGNLCAPDIIKRLEKAKATKRNRSIGYTCAAVKARYAGRDVQLFFYKKGNGSWNALVTTDMGIDANEAFKLYARRWCIEVAHKEMKGLLNLGKCQCVDFAGQIAALSLCMIQYNILGTVKRFESYETIGGLFAELTGETLELTVVQRIWGLIIEVINVIAEFLSCDPFELTENVINNNHKIKAVKMAFDRLELAGAAA